ncbi:MAG: hypothetical protein LBV32_03725 [Tannerellaceae bacterium]|jgi:hypothetical protein|nr:hypothetical protein [Tannerellaceae bacterium]
MLNTSFTRLIFATLLFASCAEEEAVRLPDDIDLQTKGYIDVTIDDGNAAGVATDDIKTIRFIIFDGQGPNAKMEVNDYRSFASEADRVAKLKGVFEVSKTDKLLVAIANEPPRLRNRLGQVMYRQELEAIQMNMSDVFVEEDPSTGDYQAFRPDVMMMPMSGALWISRDDLKTKEEAINNLTPLKLERAVARVDFYINSTYPHNTVKLKSESSFIEMNNNYTKSYFIHHSNSDNELGYIQSEPNAGELTVGAYGFPSPNFSVPNKDNTEADTDGVKDKRLLCTFYLPERLSPTGSKPLFNVNLNTTSNHGGRTAAFDLTEMTRREDQYVSAIDTIRRNNLYNVTLTFTDGMGAFETVVEVMDWNEALEERPIGLNNLKLDKASMLLPYTEVTADHDSVFNIITTHPDGWWISVFSLQGGVTVTGPDTEGEAIPANTTGTAKVTTERKSSISGSDIKGYFTVKAGNLRKNVYVTQKVPVLKHVSNTLPTIADISGGGIFSFTANTNLIEGWKLRVYRTINGTRTLDIESDLKLLEEQDRTGIEPKNSTIVNVAIPRHDTSPEHTLDFYLYSPEYDQEIFFTTKKQGKAFEPYFRINLEKTFPYHAILDRVGVVETSYEYNEWDVINGGINSVGIAAGFKAEKGYRDDGEPAVKVTTINRPLNEANPITGVTLTAGSSTIQHTVEGISQMYAKLTYTDGGRLTSTKDSTDVPAPAGITSIGGDIPAAGGRYNLGVFSNLRITQSDTISVNGRDDEPHQWGVRMYVTNENNTNRGDKLNEVKFKIPDYVTVPFNLNSTDPARNWTHRDVVIPPNPHSYDRYIAFYLYTYYPKGATEPQEVYAFTSKQLGADKLVPSYFLCPPGVLGVTADGKELTLRGSREYAGTVVERDSEFGKVHEQTVYAVYYKFNSNIAIHRDLQFTGGYNGNGIAFTGDGWNANEVAWIPPNPSSSYNTYRDLDAPSNTWSWPNNPCPFATVNKAKDKATGYKVPDSGGTVDNGGNLNDGHWNHGVGIPNDTTEVLLANGQKQLIYHRSDHYGYRFTFIDSAGNRQRTGTPDEAKMIQSAYYAGNAHFGDTDKTGGVVYLRTNLSSYRYNSYIEKSSMKNYQEWAAMIRCVDQDRSDIMK